MDDLDELYRIMGNWARPHSGMSQEDLAKLFYNQHKMLYPGKGLSHDDLRQWYLGEGPASVRGTRTPAYDSLPQKYPTFPQKNTVPYGESMDELWKRLLGPMEPGVENGKVGPSIDPRVARKFVM